MDEDIDLESLSLEEKCTHKLWRVRINGYEDFIKYFNTIPENECSDFGKFDNYMKTFCSDPNAVALDKALEAVCAFINNVSISVRTVADITEGILSKCLAAPRKTTQDKAINILLLCFKMDWFEPVQEELIRGFSHRNPKVVSGCVHVLTSALREFGQKGIDIKIILKSAITLFDHRDKTVRNEAKLYLVEMYRWIGEALLSQLTDLKPVVLHDLQLEFKKLGKEKATPKELVKSEQKIEELKSANVTVTCIEERKQKIEELKSANVTVTDDCTILAETSELKDLIEEKNILDLLPIDFYEKIEAKKWQERKESLDLLLPWTKDVKLASGDYYDLVNALLRVIDKDTNVFLVTVAGNCLTGIAKGLRKHFASYADRCLKTIMARFKEKKPSVVASLREAADAVFRCINIDSLCQSVLPFLTDKNPSVKQETSSFIARCFCYCTPKMLSRKILKFYALELLKTLQEPDSNVSYSAAEALGTALKVVGDRSMGQYLEGVEPLKLQKIRECAENARIRAIIVAKPKPTVENEVNKELRERDAETVRDSTHKDRLVQHEMPLEPNKRAAFAKLPDTQEVVSNTSQKRGRDVHNSNQMRTASVSMAPKSRNGPLLEVNTMKQVRMKDEERSRSSRWEFTDPREDLVAELKTQMKAASVRDDLLENMFRQEKKFHLKAINDLQRDLATNLDACFANLDLILKWLTIRFFDSDHTVILKCMQYLRQLFIRLSDKSYILLDFEAHSFLPYLIMKFGDPNEPVSRSSLDIMTVICNVYPSSKISPFVLEGLKAANSQQVAMCLETLGSLIGAMGIMVCQPCPANAVKSVAKLISCPDIAVRTAALNVLAKVYAMEKDKLFTYIEMLPDTDMLLLREKLKLPTIPSITHSPPSPSLASDIATSEVSTESNRKRNSVPDNTTTRSKILSPLDDTESFKSKFQKDYDYLGNLMRSIEAIDKVEDADGPTQMEKQVKSIAPVANAVNIHNDYIDDIINKIYHLNYKMVAKGLSEAEDLIKREKISILLPHIDRLLTAVSHQYNAFLVGREQERIEMLGNLTNFLMKIFQHKQLAHGASCSSLYAIGDCIFSIVVCSGLCQLGGIEVIRKLNIFVILMIQNSDYTHIFSALLKLLQKGVHAEVDGKFTEIAMKCVWKAIRAIPSKQSELNVSKVLEDLNAFLIAFPIDTWAQKSSNMPLRTMKTALHSLVETYGRQTLRHLHEISNYEGTELETYIVKLVHASERDTKEMAGVCSQSNSGKDATISVNTEQNRLERLVLNQMSAEKDGRSSQKENMMP